jgi:hypothetical protein
MRSLKKIVVDEAYLAFDRIELGFDDSLMTRLT